MTGKKQLLILTILASAACGPLHGMDTAALQDQANKALAAYEIWHKKMAEERERKAAARQQAATSATSQCKQHRHATAAASAPKTPIDQAVRAKNLAEALSMATDADIAEVKTASTIETIVDAMPGARTKHKNEIRALLLRASMTTAQPEPETISASQALVLSRPALALSMQLATLGKDIETATSTNTLSQAHANDIPERLAQAKKIIESQPFVSTQHQHDFAVIEDAWANLLARCARAAERAHNVQLAKQAARLGHVDAGGHLLRNRIDSADHRTQAEESAEQPAATGSLEQAAIPPAPASQKHGWWSWRSTLTLIVPVAILAMVAWYGKTKYKQGMRLQWPRSNKRGWRTIFARN